MDIRKTLNEREKSYGSFQDSAAIAQSMKDEAALGKAWDRMANSAKEAIHQILSKISRLVTGDPEHIDGWRDIAGYATLEADRLLGGAEPMPEPRPVYPTDHKPCPRCGTPGYVRSEHPRCKECGKEIEEEATGQKWSPGMDSKPT